MASCAEAEIVGCEEDIGAITLKDDPALSELCGEKDCTSGRHNGDNRRMVLQNNSECFTPMVVV